MDKEVSRRYASGINRLAACCLIILSVIICGAANSQGLDNVAGTDPQAGLNKAVSSFENGNYQRALELFDQLIISFPDDVRFSIFEFMKARALLKLDRLNRAEEDFENFVNEFSGSSYIGDALLLLGDIRFLKNDPYGAAYYYIQAYDRLEERKLKKKARISLSGVVQNHLSLSETEKLAEKVDRYELAPELLYMKARKESTEGYLERAGNTLEKIREKYPGSKYADPRKTELTEMLSGASEAFTIGILAPLSGGMSQFGVDMLRGIKLALEEFSISNPSTPTRIEIYDNFGTQKETINGVEHLARSGVDVIIGPLKSENAFTAAGLNKYLDMPFIVPAAAANGISSISEDIFQITPNSEYIAEVMAQYAMNDLMLEEFAIITPSDELGEDISAAFAQKVMNMGGTVHKIAFYQRGITDFKRPLTEIKVELTEGYDSLLAEGLLDSSLYVNPKNPKELLPRYEWPVELDGLFIPGYADEVAMIAPQVIFGRMQTTMLGTEGWSDPEVLSSAKGYLDGSYFATDFFPFEDDPKWASFTSKFNEHYLVDPSRIAGLCYDAAKLALNGANSPDLSDYLSSVSEYRGVSGTITFQGGNGLNREVIYCKIIDGEVVRAEY